MNRLLVTPINPFPQIYPPVTTTRQNNIHHSSSIADNLSNSESIRMSYGILFLDMIRYIHQSSESLSLLQLLNKFDIKTELQENESHENESHENESDENESHENECNICYETHEKKNFIKLNCEHEFCKECIMNSLKNEQRNIFCCAFCRTEVNNLTFRDKSVKNNIDKYLVISKLREDIN